MLIDVTVNIPPRGDIVSPALDELEGLDEDGDEDDDGLDALDGLPPEKRPITIT